MERKLLAPVLFGVTTYSSGAGSVSLSDHVVARRPTASSIGLRAALVFDGDHAALHEPTLNARIAVSETVRDVLL